MITSVGGKKKLFTLLGLFVSCGIAIFASEKYKMAQAIECGEKYLSGKYEQEMEFMGISRNRYTDGSYSLIFAPADNSDLIFHVYLASDLKPEIRADGITTYPSDSYLMAKFSYNAKQELLELMPLIETIGDLSIESGGSIYGISTLHENMSQQEMSELLTYDLWLSMHNTLSEETKCSVAENVVKLLQVVLKSTYRPDTVYLCFDENTISEKTIYILSDWGQFDSSTKLLAKLGV